MIHKRWMAWTFGIHSEGAKCFASIFCMLVYRHSVVFGRVKIWDSGTRKKLGLSLHVDVCMTATSTLVLGRTLPTQQALVREGLHARSLTWLVCPSYSGR